MQEKAPKQGYAKSLARYGQSPKALQWSSYRAAALRYRQLVKGLDFKDKTVLDAGCGMGDLLPYIYAAADNFKYLGVDRMPEFIEIAKQRYVGHDFKVADPFSPGFGHRHFDIVLSSGVMNANVSHWAERRQQMITALWQMTKDTLVFNMAGGLKPFTTAADSKVAFANANDIVEFCKTLTPKVTLRVDYHPRDFTIVMRKS